MKNSILPKLTDVNRKVDDMRASTQSNPDDITDKIIKLAIPALAGLVLTKVLQIAWKKTTKDDSVPSGADTDSSLLGAMAFASISGALAAVISRLSTKGSLALVNRRQAKKANTDKA
jgi:hypothetical protein